MLLLSFLVFAWFTLSWGGATFEAFKDPDAKQFPSGGRILVRCKSSDVGYQRKTEDTLKETIEKGTEAAVIPSYTLFLPTRTYSDDERSRLLTDSGIAGVLVVELLSSDTKTRNVGVVNPSGGVGVVTTRTKYAGLNQRFALELYELAGVSKYWVATAEASCGQWGDSADVIQSLAAGLVTKLIDEGLLVAAAPPDKKKQKHR